MDRQSFTDLIQTKFKMVRIEAGYTQDTMAQTIGLSKKTLVQIEKERVLPNWTTCISICALFRDSEVLNSRSIRNRSNNFKKSLCISKPCTNK
ncbi:hypothetical protein W248_01309 [Staphylococcus aureus DAR1883]|nr:hypothetical protein W248_01309 [Staphylococcus aureus DAR1883]